MIEKMKRWIKNKAGVSPIIAIILMVAITVVLAATIYVWVSGFGTRSKVAEEASATCQLVGATTLKFTLAKAPPGVNYSVGNFSIEVVNASDPSKRVFYDGITTDDDFMSDNANDTTIAGISGDYWDAGESIYVTLPAGVRGYTVAYTVQVVGTTILSGQIFIP
ncbi:MAG: archaellin/type IV pilin N-terminal domain-containing protein [Candidatus Thermoplasmatota archaeon]